MKTRLKLKIILSVLSAFYITYADEVSPEQALFAVNVWQTSGGYSSMRQILNSPNGNVSTLIANGAAACHVVELENGGFVITSGDDCDPVAIRGFSDRGTFDPSVDSPLKDLLVVSATSPTGSSSGMAYGASTNDAVFIQKTVDLTSLKRGNSYEASSSWKELLSPSALKTYATGLSSVDDICVAPMLQTKWNQGSVGDKTVYNYYTPNNYMCGCVATAMAQIMRYHEYPQSSVSRVYKKIVVNGTDKNVWTYGGTYDWDNMPYVPDSSITDTEREAIGKLTYDCGVSVNMEYSSGGSGAVTPIANEAFTDVFGYANAKYITGDYSKDGKTYYDVSLYTNKYKRAIISNLNAGLPVLLGVRENLTNGHAIVGDGYGYIDGVVYYHLNMGWGGYCDLWYTIPEVTTPYNFNVLGTVVYNVSPTNTGEIVSGRIKDEYGNPVAGANVTVAANGESQTVQTSDTGVWAAFVESGKAYSISVESRGYIAQTKTTETVAESVTEYFPDDAIVGNIWDCDFTLVNSSMAVKKITSFNVGALQNDGTRQLLFGFATGLTTAEVYFSEKVDGSYTALPSSSISVSEDGLSLTATLDGENAAKPSGFIQILGR